jgi:ribonuclease BN (tRNA processing enzyme)
MRATSTWLLLVASAIGLTAFLARGGAQTNARASQPAEGLKGTRLVTLGTAGGPLPREDRTQASNLLIVDGAPYMIDAGDNVTRRIVQAGADFRKVDQVFLTHNHSDHTMGLATLMVSQWEYQRRDPLNIFGPSGTAALVNGAMQFLAVNAEIRWAEGKRISMPTVFKGHDVAPGLVFQDSRVKVTGIENTHFNFPEGSPPHGKHKSYSYRFETPDRVIAFTGDTGLTDAVIGLAKGADVLVTEVTSVDDTVALFKQNGLWAAKTADEQASFVRHLREEHVTPEDVGRMASKAGVKMVVMTHISPTVGNAFERYGELAQKYFTGRIVMAKDLMQF